MSINPVKHQASACNLIVRNNNSKFTTYSDDSIWVEAGSYMNEFLLCCALDAGR